MHQTPPKIKLDWPQNTGMWTVLGRINDEEDAKARMKAAIENSNYDLFGHIDDVGADIGAVAIRRAARLLVIPKDTP